MNVVNGVSVFQTQLVKTKDMATHQIESGNIRTVCEINTLRMISITTSATSVLHSLVNHEDQFHYIPYEIEIYDMKMVSTDSM